MLVVCMLFFRKQTVRSVFLLPQGRRHSKGPWKPRGWLLATAALPPGLGTPETTQRRAAPRRAGSVACRAAVLAHRSAAALLDRRNNGVCGGAAAARRRRLSVGRRGTGRFTSLNHTYENPRERVGKFAYGL